LSEELRRNPHDSEDSFVFLAPDGRSLLCGEAGRLLEVEDIINRMMMLVQCRSRGVVASPKRYIVGEKDN